MTADQLTVSHVVVGVGMSSRATRDEILALVTATLAHAGHNFPPGTIATRSHFVGDPRLDLGCPIVAFDDQLLVDRSPPLDRRAGLPARVAETAAALAARIDVADVGPTARSAHVAVAVAVAEEQR
ncbi:MAG: hypothetical protein ACK5RL_02510 [Acidimicrobiales bacterium]